MMASFAFKTALRYAHLSKRATRRQVTRRHNPIPQKVMNTNTYWKFPEFNKQGIQPQQFDYFLVLDFEATCEERTQLKYQEIIEFPCLKVDSKTFEVVDVFHEYIRPVINPTLTVFCIQLTGIIQDMVDDRPEFKDVLGSFLDWLLVNNLHPYGDKPNSIFVTCGDWDLKTMLPAQCAISKQPVPKEMLQWINIKKEFHRSTGYFPRGLKDMLLQLNLQHQGKLHSGIDDCSNMVRIMKALAERSLIFDKTL